MSVYLYKLNVYTWVTLLMHKLSLGGKILIMHSLLSLISILRMHIFKYPFPFIKMDKERKKENPVLYYLIVSVVFYLHSSCTQIYSFSQ